MFVVFLTCIIFSLKEVYNAVINDLDCKYMKMLNGIMQTQSQGIASKTCRVIKCISQSNLTINHTYSRARV